MRPIAALLLCAILVAGCDSSSSDEEALLFRVDLDVDGLVPLQNAHRYQVWAVVDGQMVGSDEFNISESGQFVNTAGQLISRTLSFDRNVGGASELFVVINGKTDNSEAPSSKIVMAGDVSGRSVTFSTTHPTAFGAAMGSASGQFVLTTPTDLDGSNERSGIWFGTPSGAGLSPALNVPALAPVWIYESWVSLPGGAVLSMGRFDNATTNDDARPYSFPDEIATDPDMPGEDFLLNAPDGLSFPTDLSGATVFITVELDPDDAVDVPSGIRVLEGSVPAGASARTPYALSLSNQVPGGTGTLN